MNMNHALASKRNHSALTFIELVAVIIIIIAIVWVLLPATTGRRPPPLKVMDMSNLRQIVHSMIIYSVDHGEVLPSHPRDANEHLGYDPAIIEELYLNPYQDGDEAIDRGDGDGIAVRYGGYVFVNLGLTLDEIDKPDELILAYTAKITPEQGVRNVAFADGHVESWEEEQLRAALPEGVDVDALDGL